jgi:hypothetical protein
LKTVPHSLDSPDISPSDFYRFGAIKGALIGQQIPDEISLFGVVTEILNGISTGDLQRVFRSWIERVENVITAEEGDASSQTSRMSLFDVIPSVLCLA